ncbi:MAG: hypothetical protein ABIT01_16410 [Thermoanaerobaculia bacterium]
MRTVCLAVLCLGLTVPARAQELGLMVGGRDKDLAAIAWELEYKQALSAPVALSATWLNEGHLADRRHRDGLALQLWGETPRFGGFSIGIGAGAYTYFSTQPGADEGSFIQQHGTLPVVSLAAAYRPRSPWSVRFVIHHIAPLQDGRTTAYLLGGGYRFDTPRSGVADSGSTDLPIIPGQHELTLLAGMASTNSDKSQSAPAFALEYRRRFARFGEAALSYLNEGDTQISRRHGVTGQVFLVREFRRVALGLGAGGYWATDRPEGAAGRTDLNGLVMLSGALRLRSQGRLRIALTRVVTGHERDSDVIQIGYGYRWGRRQFLP